MDISKILIAAGIILIFFGVILKLNFFGLGRLPGDILIKKGDFTFYFPVATSILLSILIGLVIHLLRK